MNDPGLATRRTFIAQTLATGTLVPWRAGTASAVQNAAVPAFLRGYESLFHHDPRQATLDWFRASRYGMFIHYALASMLPGGKRDPWAAGVNADELRRQFSAERFDADAIADLAADGGMGYVNFTPYHGGGPYLFRSQVVGPALPKGRDLTAEVADACTKRGLGLFLYIHISLSQSHDGVVDRNHAVLREMLTQYGPLAGLWFDTDHQAYRHPEHFPRLRETYALIRHHQPHALISFCRGVHGDEDFVTYEHHVRDRADLRRVIPPDVEARLREKAVEVCTTLQLNPNPAEGALPGSKMWFAVDDALHRDADDVWALLKLVRQADANLLLNVAPRGDGSVHPAEEATLREVGRRLRQRGWPEKADSMVVP